MSKYLINSATLLAIMLILGTAAFGQRSTVLGGYKSAKTDDARVVAAAEFAVGERAEKNTEQEGLTLDSVDKAEMQTVAGTNYRLCLTVRLEDETQQIEAVIFQNLKREYTLKSWTVKECAEKSVD